MPLYTFICNECGTEYEKFFHKLEDDLEVLCEKCNNICEKKITLCGTKVEFNAKEYFNNKILPDAKKIMDRMSNGSDKDFFDVYGDE